MQEHLSTSTDVPTNQHINMNMNIRIGTDPLISRIRNNKLCKFMCKFDK
jgi:hypothetical protein